jgi:acyl-CoA reductase-like NAD-dependent aldehyde dehydrogenase
MVQGVQIVDGCIVDVNPATGEVIAHVKCSTQSDVESMIAAARAAQLSWQHDYSAVQRGSLIKEALKTLGLEKAALAQLITQEMGKVLREAADEAEGATNKDAWIDEVTSANRIEVVNPATLTFKLTKDYCYCDHRWLEMQMKHRVSLSATHWEW